MNRKTTIEVTAEDISEARAKYAAGTSRSSCCPIALAVQRVCNNPDILIGGRSIIPLRHFKQRQDLPEEAAGFITRFDRHEYVEPFSFEVDLPETLFRSSDA